MTQTNRKLYELTRSKLLTGELSPLEGARQLFSFGYSLDRAGQMRDAQKIYHQTAEALERACMSIHKTGGAHQLADCAFQHGAELLAIGRTKEAVAALREAEKQLLSLLPNGVAYTIINKLMKIWTNIAVGENSLGNTTSAKNYQSKVTRAEKTLLAFKILK